MSAEAGANATTGVHSAMACGIAAAVLSSPPMTDERLHRTLDALWRMESPRLVARIARMTGDVSVAEELAQDVLLSALER